MHHEPVAGLGPQLAAEVLQRVGLLGLGVLVDLGGGLADLAGGVLDGLGGRHDGLDEALVAGVAEGLRLIGLGLLGHVLLHHWYVVGGRPLGRPGAHWSDWPAKTAKTSLPNPRSSTEISAIITITKVMTTKK